MNKYKSFVEHIIHEFLGKGNLSQYEKLIAKNVTIHHLTGQTLYKFNRTDQVGEVWQAWDMLGLLGQLQTFYDDKFLHKAASLSKRERDCLKHLLMGKTAKETALLMKLSFRTVEYYFENIKDKMGCYSKRELVACAHMLESNSYPLR